MKIHLQFIRYAIVGFCSNAVLYFIYLVATSLVMGHKISLTLFYAIGILLTFLFNSRLTCDHNGLVTNAFIRYISAYELGYIFNLTALFLFVDKLEFPHHPVQGILIFVVAVLLFLLQRLWVFNDKQQEAI